jgi:hypothetical protein
VLRRGVLRFSRIENLLRESAKSRGFQADGSLWLLAEWVLSDAGAAVRSPLVAEAVRIIDAVIAGMLCCKLCQQPEVSGFLMSSSGAKPFACSTLSPLPGPV